MEMTISMPGAGRVEAHFGGLTVTTDQDGTAPNPFALFLASIGTCAGIYVARFCQSRGVPHDGDHGHPGSEESTDGETEILVVIDHDDRRQGHRSMAPYRRRARKVHDLCPHLATIPVPDGRIQSKAVRQNYGRPSFIRPRDREDCSAPGSPRW